MAQHIPQGYPYPEIKTSQYDFDVDRYDEARLAWMESLNDYEVRSFAADYRMGKRTEDAEDGYSEFIRRGFDKKDAVAKSKRPPSPKKRRKNVR